MRRALDVLEEMLLVHARVQMETLRLDFQSSDVLVRHDVGT